MGQFANTVFSMLLGWVPTAASWLWELISDTDVKAWLDWMLDNWLPLTLMLCAAGLLVDFGVYLIRWQPYRVWGGVLRRLTGRDKAEAEREEQALQARFQRKWVYADGSTRVEDIRETARMGNHSAEEPDHLELPIRPVRRVPKHAPPEQSYYQPVYPPQWQKTEENQQGENE